MLLDAAYNKSLLKASHKSKPSSVSQDTVDSYFTMGHVGGGNRCGRIP
jgi:hypothetical protein